MKADGGTRKAPCKEEPSEMMASVSGVTMRNSEPRISVGKTSPQITGMFRLTPQQKLESGPLKHPFTDITPTGWKEGSAVY